MRYRRLKIEGACYFFTLVTEQRRRLFDDAETVALLQAAIDVVKDRHPFVIEAQVIMPDHLHALWRLPDGDADYSTRWRLIKERFSKSFVKRFGKPDASASRRQRGEQAIWQRRFWEHLIRDDGDFNAHFDYIHLNPVRHGYVQAAREWPHSTFSHWVERGVYEPHWGSGELPPMPDWAEKCE